MAESKIAADSEESKKERRRKYKREYIRRWRRANPEKRREYKRIYYARNPEKIKARVRRWRNENPEKLAALNKRRKPSDREWCLKKKYGLSLEQWNALFAMQGWVCAACGADKPGSKSGWHTDHCHSSGMVRGILCVHCNVGIGKAKDNTTTMRKWIAYVERHK